MTDNRQLTVAPPLTDRQRDVRDAFIRRRGYWADDWDLINRLDVDFMSAYTELSSYAKEHGSLDEKTREFVYIATCASVTHCFVIGIRQHMRNALDVGATPAELLAVLEVLSTMGVASWHLAVEELEHAKAGSSSERQASDAEIEKLKTSYVAIFGVWDPDIESAMRADPGYYEAYLGLAAVPRTMSRAITPRQAALVSLSANACVTHMDRSALRRDVASALHYGATPGEIKEVCAIISGIGVHALSLGVPALAEILAERGRTPYDG